MLGYFVLLLVLSVCAGSLVVAVNEQRRIARDVQELVAGVEIQTRDGGDRDGGVRADVSSTDISQDVEELLADIIGADRHAVAVLAVNELTGRASLARGRSQSLARGLSRICLLSGGAGAFAVAALGAFDRRALVLAGGAFGLGLVSAFLAHALSSRARRHAKKFAELTDVLARQVEDRFRDESS